MTGKTDQEKLSYLSEISEPEVFAQCADIVEALAISADDDIRQELALLLGDFPSDHSRQILLKLLYDKDEMVQLEAADNLSEYVSDEVYNALMSFTQTQDWLLRGYALLGISRTCLEDKDSDTILYLKDRFVEDKSKFCRICICNSLCLLGEREYIYVLFRYYPKSYYRNKCSILNTLWDLLNEAGDMYRKEIRRFAEEIAESVKREDKAVKGTYESLLRFMEE